MIAEALTFETMQDVTWQRRSKRDPMALHLFDGHYSCQTHPPGEVGPPGRKLVLVSPCERAVWCSHWPYAAMTLDGLDAYRNCVFRNLGAGLSSELILDAMRLTLDTWGESPRDGWVTWIDTRHVKSRNPGYCYKMAGWWLDRDYQHRYLLRLRHA